MFKFYTDFTVKAPAKVNLHLAVKDRREDGFHNLESLFLAVDFCDILKFRLIEGEKLTKIDMEGLKFTVKDKENIIFKAISLFREKTGFDKGLEVNVVKNIPLGGGLGGGSSDAASTLLALNKMTDFPLTKEQLLEIGAVLGSDVPFFLHETPAAWVTGRGELIKPLKTPQMFIALVNPGFPSDTARAFRLLDEKREHYATKFPAQEIFDCLESHDSWFEKNIFSSFYNDFLEIFDESEKEAYDKIISDLYESGAVYANLSGSGSTCFGIFKERVAEKMSLTANIYNAAFH
ncbi:MAG: 4-(cytidine 5'-diphospho)-2-C-methyl-D-erythritol kinase [Treponema sp.]|nr:4-(cytidine 5'-diphospho)-2-C-methyl-D-erythritol kinase [Treponema sp.]MCL2251843.1 4-(cytidine 5'-diphospho)-2-C-methyl-D-erythritol kinase [Treponema sp.]